MYKEIEIENFKTFKKLKIGGLKRVNLIAGKNAVGKSALLEAIFLHAGGENPALLLNISGFRGVRAVPSVRIGEETPWDYYFHNFETSETIKVRAVHSKFKTMTVTAAILKSDAMRSRGEYLALPSEQQAAIGPALASSVALEIKTKSEDRESISYAIADTKEIKLSPSPQPRFMTWHIGPRTGIGVNEVRNYNELEVRNQHEDVLKFVQEYAPKIRRITSYQVGPEPVLMADIGLSRMIPLTFVSEGIGKLATFIITIAVAKGGILLIDEIENGLHYSILQQVWKSLAKAAAFYDVQIFATTHSREAIISAHNAFSKMRPYDFTYHRLDPSPDGVKVVRYDKADLEAADEINYEVR